MRIYFKYIQKLVVSEGVLDNKGCDSKVIDIRPRIGKYSDAQIIRGGINSNTKFFCLP